MKRRRTPCRVVGSLLSAAGLVILVANARAGEIKNPSDHLLSGFPLTGAHVIVPCEQCHSAGVFAGTPTRCTWCHTQGGPVAASVKNRNHIPTTMDCEVCHTDRSWHGARLDHFLVSQPCVTCHNNATARGQPNGHLVTSAPCDTCHGTTHWKSSQRQSNSSRGRNGGATK